MPDLSTEPKMMRSQQDKDTPEHLSEDETRSAIARSDADSESRKDREASKAGTATYQSEQQTAIFEENRHGNNDGPGDGEEKTAASHADDADDREEGMASRGRSRL
ncbi:hypothetical protein [Fulvimarina sp. MAC3]|uniref:hypothetical protein n=1 Tax=Fulvimarina sp. MAC3 TaxID=3148887 RepID=UPI0031FD8F3E